MGSNPVGRTTSLLRDCMSKMSYPDPKLLRYVPTPAFIIEGSRVDFANGAARALLGEHIVGEDLRIALRDPKAVAAITATKGGSETIEGLSVKGSRWRLRCHVIDSDVRLVLLEDQSVRVSVARAHADFVANASHELRTPLAAVLGYVETLGDPKAGADDETRGRFLGIIRHEAQRMQSLVEDLMSLSRIEAVKHETPSEPLDLLLQARAAVGESQAGGKVEISANAETAVIAGDAGQIAQVLRNLIDNALKYGKPGGMVVVGIETTDSGWVMLSVDNEGDGIAPAHLPRLTERFYRADAGRSRAVGGTGLGLSIVKHIVERHRGRFDIANRLGGGVTATIMLPLLKT